MSIKVIQNENIILVEQYQVQFEQLNNKIKQLVQEQFTYTFKYQDEIFEIENEQDFQYAIKLFIQNNKDLILQVHVQENQLNYPQPFQQNPQIQVNQPKNFQSDQSFQSQDQNVENIQEIKQENKYKIGLIFKQQKQKFKELANRKLITKQQFLDLVGQQKQEFIKNIDQWAKEKSQKLEVQFNDQLQQSIYINQQMQKQLEEEKQQKQQLFAKQQELEQQIQMLNLQVSQQQFGGQQSQFNNFAQPSQAPPNKFDNNQNNQFQQQVSQFPPQSNYFQKQYPYKINQQQNQQQSPQNDNFYQSNLQKQQQQNQQQEQKQQKQEQKLPKETQEQLKQYTKHQKDEKLLTLNKEQKDKLISVADVCGGHPYEYVNYLGNKQDINSIISHIIDKQTSQNA